MRAEPGMRPEDNENEIDLERDPSQREHEILQDELTVEEAEGLKRFIESKLPANSDKSDDSSTVDLAYRPDAWDPEGVIEKLYLRAKEYIKESFQIDGYVEPKKFKLIRTENAQTYKEQYLELEEQAETSYTATVSLLDLDIIGGTTLYTINGEGFVPRNTDLVIHRNEKLNNWEIVEVLSGTRFDLVMVFRDTHRRISYGYYIDQIEDEGEDY